MAQNETARATVYLDGKQAEAALSALAQKAKDLRKDLTDALQAGDNVKYDKLKRELSGIEAAQRSLKKETFDVERVLQNINKVSWRDLEKAQSTIINQMKGMTRGTEEFTKKAEELKKVRTALADINSETRAASSSWSLRGMADGINKYFGLITAFIASLTGLVLGFKQVVQSFNDFQERVGNLSALTGLAGKSLDWLTQKAKDLSTSTLEGGIRVRQTALQIVDAFTKTGSARPELLKNKEALAEVTQEAIILANAAKTELQPAIEGLTMVLNQYNVPADQSRRIINAMAAGSKEGAGEIPYITQAFEKAGTVAADANIPIETLIATIETLAPRITQPEIAGRTLKAVLIDLQQGADDTNPAIVGMATAFDNLAKKNLNVTQLTALFGLENVTTAKILINNVGELKKYEAAVTGTNVAIEQATINTDNNNSKLEQAKNKINVVSIALGEKLAPSLTFVTGWYGKALTIVSALIDVFIKYGSTIITATAAVVAYTVAVKVATMWQTRANQATLAQIVTQKINLFLTEAQFAATQLWAAAQMLLTGNIVGATQAMRVFNATTKLNPIGLIIGLLVAAGTALYFYAAKLTDVQIAQKAVNDINLEARKSIVEEKIKLESLLDVAKNEKLSKTERLDAIRQLNAISPEYLGNLTLESINTDKAKKSVDAYTDSLLEKAKVIAAEQKLAEIEKQRLDDLASGADRKVTFWQSVGVAILYNSNLEIMAKEMEAKATENATKANETYLAKIKAVKDIINQGNTGADDKSLNSDGKGKEIKATEDLLKLKEQELEAAKRMPGSTLSEIAARNKKVEAIQKEINKLNELGTTKEGSADRKANKKELEAAEAENKKAIDLINKRHIETKNSEDQYNADLLDQESAFLRKKLTIYKAGSKEYEDTAAELSQNQVKAEQQVKDLLLKAEKVLADAKINNLKEGIDKEKALEEQRWKNELDGLKKQLLEKEKLSKDEIALNDTINNTIKEKTTAHNKVIADLNQAGQLQKQMDKALIDQANSQSDEQRWAAETELAKAQHDQELTDAKGNAAKIAQAERNLSDRLIAIKKDELDKRQAIGDAIFNSAGNLFGALSDLVGKETALGKALFLMQQAAAIGQIVFNTAIANAKAVAASPLTFGQPWVTINTVSAGAGIASVLAQTVSSFTGAGKKGKQSGGYADSDVNDSTPVGVYHANEFIASAPAVRNPTVKPILDIIDIAQRTGTIRSLNLPAVVGHGKQSGGYASTQTVSSVSPTMVSFDAETTAINKALIEEIRHLRIDGVKATINKFGTNGLSDALNDIANFNSKIGKKS